MTVAADVVSVITHHHAELAEELTSRVDAVVDAARAGAPYEEPAARLRELLVHDIVPHARAEEGVLYAAATADTLRPLVTGMIYEHETLLDLAHRLAAAATAVDAAAAASAIEAVFLGHVRRENELLLPALATDPRVDLPELLPVMEHRFTTYRQGGERSASGVANVLDVRQEIPARRHDLIFQTYADLAAGDGFVLVNDHDPKPLYYQFAAEHENEFEWDYLEQGPQVWRVRIGRPAA